MEQMFAEVWRLVKPGMILGIGTGSTVESWLAYGLAHGYELEVVVASSQRTAKYLTNFRCEVADLQAQAKLDLYIDGADEVNAAGICIKGGGGAMTLEKIVCSSAREFICIASEKKYKAILGEFPLAVEVLPQVRSYVARKLLELGGDPVYREGFQTDSGNCILDVFGLDFTEVSKLERALDSMLGVVGHGLFVTQSAHKIYLATANNFKLICPK